MAEALHRFFLLFFLSLSILPCYEWRLFLASFLWLLYTWGRDPNPNLYREVGVWLALSADVSSRRETLLSALTDGWRPPLSPGCYCRCLSASTSPRPCWCSAGPVSISGRLWSRTLFSLLFQIADGRLVGFMFALYFVVIVCLLVLLPVTLHESSHMVLHLFSRCILSLGLILNITLKCQYY